MLALGSAAIGASGAVLSQVVSGVVTGKREQRKATVDAERWSYEAEASRRDRHLDRKIELFRQFLSTSESMTTSTSRALWGRESEESQEDAYRQLCSIAEEIGILAPELYDLAQSTAQSAAVLVLASLKKPNVRMARSAEDAEEIEAEEEDEKGQRVNRMMTSSNSLAAWTDIFRAATHAYISHRPIQPQQEAEAQAKAQAENPRLRIR